MSFYNVSGALFVLGIFMMFLINFESDLVLLLSRATSGYHFLDSISKTQ